MTRKDTTMTVSFEIAEQDRSDSPPYSERCPRCEFAGVVVPHTTVTYGDQLFAFYGHGRCGNEWVTSWEARWSDTWVRVIGDGPRAIAA
jgi:hypothetical protein